MEKSGDGEVTKLNVEEEEEEKRVVLCGKKNGNGWKCKKQAAKGKVFCNHHLEQLRNYEITRKKKMMIKKMMKTEKEIEKGDQIRKKKMMKKKMKTERGDQVRGRVRARKASLDSNPYDYYYYSGFGPSWGKNRGNTNTNNIKNNESVAQEEESSIFSSSSSSSEMCEIDELDYSKRDDNEIWKKRGGSPIINLEEDEEKKVLCRRMSGSGWKCHAVAARGKIFLCEHHLEQKRNYQIKKKKMKMKKDRAAPVVMKETFLSNSHLCSGNGTADWGKNIAVDTKSYEVYADYEASCFSPSACDISEIDRIRIDYAEDDDED